MDFRPSSIIKGLISGYRTVHWSPRESKNVTASWFLYWGENWQFYPCIPPSIIRVDVKDVGSLFITRFRAGSQGTLPLSAHILPPANEVWGKVIFSQVCVSHSSGGSRISPRRGRRLPGGVPTYNFAKFSQKLHEIERIWVPGGHAPLAPPLDPPLHSVYRGMFLWMYVSVWCHFLSGCLVPYSLGGLCLLSRVPSGSLCIGCLCPGGLCPGVSVQGVSVREPPRPPDSERAVRILREFLYSFANPRSL